MQRGGRILMMVASAATLLGARAQTAKADPILLDSQTYFGCMVTLAPQRCFTYHIDLYRYPDPRDGTTFNLFDMIQVSGPTSSPYTAPFIFNYAVAANFGDTYWGANDRGLTLNGFRYETFTGVRGDVLLPLAIDNSIIETTASCRYYQSGFDSPCGQQVGAEVVTFRTAAIVTPEPTTITFMATGLIGLAGVARWKRCRHDYDAGSM